MIAVDLNKHQALDVNPKAINTANQYTGNLSGNNNRLMFLIVEKWKKLFWFFTRNGQSIVILFCFSILKQHKITILSQFLVKHLR